ncbi:hypothetical protein K469DRAFT_209279 [Zopfia rhizophila CBS 207.26]|uniref:Uncharacterized protein n=1 Tax=Zopfia rhizophila CBS 207.26 TaxID=1314779 RepID=A0A6A6DV15_9PEZI|nr:hypothetical protein K469DRAFT_209279 [Zopfia rhizophila CBS 207.26]
MLSSTFWSMLRILCWLREGVPTTIGVSSVYIQGSHINLESLFLQDRAIDAKRFMKCGQEIHELVTQKGGGPAQRSCEASGTGRLIIGPYPPTHFSIETSVTLNIVRIALKLQNNKGKRLMIICIHSIEHPRYIAQLPCRHQRPSTPPPPTPAPRSLELGSCLTSPPLARCTHDTRINASHSPPLKMIRNLARLSRATNIPASLTGRRVKM